MKIENDVLNVLGKSTVEGQILFLPPTQLERNLYVKVNKCLESIGGKWNRAKKGHVFELSVDVSDLLDEMINSGEYADKKKEFQFFETPEEVGKKIISLAEIETYMKILEPSFGKGAILNLIPEPNDIYGVELNKDNFEYVSKNAKIHYRHLVEADFLIPQEYDRYIPENFDRIVMNPPFSKHQDIKHIFQAWDLLKPGGILVSVVSESPFFREDKISISFRNWLKENNAEDFELESGAFKKSGTMVKTRIIKVKK